MEGINFPPGWKVQFLAKSGLNSAAILLDKQSLLEDVPRRPYTQGGRCPFQIEVTVMGMVGTYLGYRGRTTSIEVKFPFYARLIVFRGMAEDFELAD